MTHGVIFDCDGVLVDSETLSNGIAAEMLTQLGLPTSTEAAMRDFMGSSTAEVSAELEQRLGRPLPDDFWRDYATRCQERFMTELRSVSGIEAALDHITIPACVASSGSHEKIRFTLGHTGLLERFEGRIFSATEVTHGKPAPDLFLHAAKALGFDPSKTVVVEDAPRGVQAGVAAGMTVLAYAGHPPFETQLAAAGGTVFHDMADLPSLVHAALGL